MYDFEEVIFDQPFFYYKRRARRRDFVGRETLTYWDLTSQPLPTTLNYHLFQASSGGWIVKMADKLVFKGQIFFVLIFSF
jgi:hypothetical protein